jgi:outer membrane protein TolC
MNLRKKGLVFLCASLVMNSMLSAQEKRPLTMSEAIQLGIQNNKQLKNSQAKIDEANAMVKEAEDRRLPDASITGSYIRLNNPNVDLKTKSTSSGGTTTGSTPKITQALYGIANVSMPIYAGGKIRYGIESAKYLAEAARLDAGHDKDAVVENTVEAYINLFKAMAGVQLVQENLNESRAREKDLGNLEKNGLLARNDLLKAQLQTANMELALLDAQNNLQLANMNMDLMLGLPDKTEIVPDSASILQPMPAKTLDEVLQAAIQNRNDITALGLRKKASLVGEKTVRAEYMPSLAATGGYIAADIPNFLTITNAVNVGLGVSYNLGSLWKTKAKIQQAEARTRQLAANEEILNDQVRLQVNQAYLNWLSSQKKIEVYAKAVDLAADAYRVIKNKYNNSLATTTDLLDADVAQLQARMNYTNARADEVVAYNRLLQAAGTISSNK